MPHLLAISKIDFPHKIAQKEVKKHAEKLFKDSFPQVNRMLSAFDNTEIINRNFCKPLNYYAESHTFEEQNNVYIQTTLEYSIKAIEACLIKAKIAKTEITDIVFVSTTGLATPSMDALIINAMRLNENIGRIPIFGLGCAGGVSGFAKACGLAVVNPKGLVLLVAAELCSLTFLKSDYSKSNFIGSSLFSDGISACLIVGDKFELTKNLKIKFVGAQSKIYFDTLDIMGWEFQDKGFKVLFSRDIPTLISDNINNDVSTFLTKHNLGISDIKNFIFHPGGKKVLQAYEESLNVKGDFLKNTREVMNEFGNMSSPTVLYVLEKYFNLEFEPGYALMAAMGPGFSSEMVLLKIEA